MNQQFDEHLTLELVAHLTNANGTTMVALGGGTTSGWRWDTAVLCNTDSIAHKVDFQYNQGGAVVNLGAVAVPAGAGTGVVPAVDALAALPAGLQAGLVVKSGDALNWGVEETITAPTFVGLLLVGGSF